MNTFKLKYKIGPIILAYVGVGLCVAVFAATLWRLLHNGWEDFYDVLQYVILLLIPIFAAVLLLGVVYHSKYQITEDKFITYFAFIKSTFPIADMTKIVLDKKNCRLAIYTGEKFMTFLLNEKWSKQFIDLLLSKNGKIFYDELEEVDEVNKKKDDNDQPNQK